MIKGKGMLEILREPEKYKSQILDYVKSHFNSKNDEGNSEVKKLLPLYMDRCFLSGWLGNQMMHNHRPKVPTLGKIEIFPESGLGNDESIPDPSGRSETPPSGLVDRKEWFPCNPSICLTYDKQGYYLLQRLVNFSSQRATNYVSHSNDGKFSTRNLLLTLNPDFHIVKWVEVIDLSNRKLYPKHVQGLEDMQIFQIKEKNKKNKGKRLGFVCTLVDCQENGVPLMGFGLININTGQISKIKTLKAPFPSGCEKNWLPRSIGSKTESGVELLYHGCQMTRLKFNLDQYYSDSYNPKGQDPGEIQTVMSGTLGKKNELRDVRGGSWIPFENGFLLLFHEVIWIYNGRTYIHRFVQTDETFQVQRISHFFTFENKDIEFARSMSWNLTGDEILIGVGLEDHYSYIYRLSPEMIKEMLIFL